MDKKTEAQLREEVAQGPVVSKWHSWDWTLAARSRHSVVTIVQCSSLPTTANQGTGPNSWPGVFASPVMQTHPSPPQSGELGPTTLTQETYRAYTGTVARPVPLWMSNVDITR